MRAGHAQGESSGKGCGPLPKMVASLLGSAVEAELVNTESVGQLPFLTLHL